MIVKRLLPASFLAAVAMFVFGSVFWMSPMPYSAVSTVADDAVVQSAIREHFPETGLYYVPSVATFNADPDRFTELHVAGPVVEVNVAYDVGEPMQPGVFLAGFLHQWVICFLIGLLLLKVAPVFPTFASKVGFVTVLGLLGALFINVGQVIWWREPVGWQLWNVVYNTVAWVLAGLVIARMLPNTPAHPA